MSYSLWLHTGIAGAAQAQQSAASGADAILAGPGITMGTAATMPLKYVEIRNTDLVTSKLISTKIYNEQNESVGSVSDAVIGDGKSVIGVVASVGGFLGMSLAFAAPHLA